MHLTSRKSVTAVALASLSASLLLGGAVPAAAGSDMRPTITHGETHTEDFETDICNELGDPSDRSSTTTFTATMTNEKFREMANGSLRYHYVEVVTYVSEYNDPSIGTVTGRLTEAVNFTINPGGTVNYQQAFHDSFADIKIWYQAHFVGMDGQDPIIEREILKVTGCP